MSSGPNLVFIWTDQQRWDTLGAYGNETIETPNLEALAGRGTVFQNPYVTKPLCSPSRSAVMTGRYPHTTGVIENNIPLPADERCLPELGDFEEYATGWIGKWHLGDEVFAQHGFDEWIATEDTYRDYYADERSQYTHSDYHDFLIKHGYEPDQEEPDGFEWFSRRYVATSVSEEHSKPAFMAQKAIEFIETHHDEPFILYVMFLEPHPPYTSPRDNQYDPDEVTLRDNVEHDNFDEQVDRVRFVREIIQRGVSGPSDIIGTPPTEEGWRKLISNYWGLVSLVDTHVGRILDAIDDAGLDDDTITVFTSDHGDMMGSHGIVAKHLQFEEAIKVPLIVRIPDTAIGATVETPVSQIDLVPTLLDAMDQPTPDHLHGQSWLPYLQDEGELVEENVFVEWTGGSTPGIINGVYESPWVPPHPTDEGADIWAEMDTDRDLIEMSLEPVRTVITPDGWKLNYRLSGEHELYNLQQDPYEMENLANNATHADRIDELYEIIIDWQRRTYDSVRL